MLHFVDGKHPHDHTDLPEMSKLVADLDWDVLCLFDAGRWDYYDEFFGGAEPVQSPGTSTKEWLKQGIVFSDTDWSDVTYVHTDEHIAEIESPRSNGYSDEESGESGKTLSDAVGTVKTGVRLNGDIYEPSPEYYEFNRRNGPFDKTAVGGLYDPEMLTKWAVNTAEPPMVIHYHGPHRPLEGRTSLDVDEIIGKNGKVLLNEELWQDDNIYSLAQRNHISSDLLRLMYYHNYRPAVAASRKLTKRYDRVVWTADHGEGLGPTTYEHDDDNGNTRTVPLDLSWDADIGMPEDHGATQGRAWDYFD